MIACTENAPTAPAEHPALARTLRRVENTVDTDLEACDVSLSQPVAVVFDRPGRTWDRRDLDFVCRWTLGESAWLLAIAVDVLDPPVPPDEFADILGSFFVTKTQREGRFWGVLRSYDPAKGAPGKTPKEKFRTLLGLAFRQHCIRHGKRMETEAKRKATLADLVKQPGPGTHGLKGSVNPGPYEGHDRTVRLVLECLETLTPIECEVVKCRIFEDQSSAEIARELDITEGNERVIFYRGRRKLRVCLEKKGVKFP